VETDAPLDNHSNALPAAAFGGGRGESASEPIAVASGGHRNRPVSWVRRGVRMTEGQAAAWESHGYKYLIEPPRGVSRESIAPGWTLDLPKEFEPRDEQLHQSSEAQSRRLRSFGPELTEASRNHRDANARYIIEIGTGRGENIVAAAERDPDNNYLGVEVYGPGLARAILLATYGGATDDAQGAIAATHVNEVSETEIAMQSAVQAGTAAKFGGAHTPDDEGETLANLRLIQADAPEVLAALPDAAVDEIWVFFPDPWPKNRHQKRRLVDAGFTGWVARVLKPGGIIRLATDWEHYAEQMQQVFAAAPGLVAEPTGRFEGRVLTAFERKGIREGRTIHDFAFRRLPIG